MNKAGARPPDPLLGRTLAGKYALEALVGVGAMGRVYRATQQSLDKAVAVKVLHAALSADEGARARFFREAKLASSFEHPNSLQVFDYGVEPDGLIFLVMEFLEGESLQRLITREAPLPLPRVVKVMGSVLSALAAAHEAGIVHRDLKPENIMLVERLDDDGERVELVKVTDFGIARLLVDGEGDVKLTATGLIPGTPAYMSPEQGRGQVLDGRSDLYACGVMLFEMATGRLPFLAENAIALVLRNITEAPPAPSSINPSVDPRLEAIILRTLEKSPDARYPTARAMRAALRAVSSGAVPATHDHDLEALGVPVGAATELDLSAPRAAAAPGLSTTSPEVLVAPAAPPTSLAQGNAAPPRGPSRAPYYAVGALAIVAAAVIASRASSTPPTITERRPEPPRATAAAHPEALAPATPPPLPPPTAAPAPVALIKTAPPRVVATPRDASQRAARAHEPAATAPQPIPTAPQPAAPTPQPTPTAPQPAATAPQPAATAPQPPPRELRGVRGALSELSTGGGLTRGALQSRASRAATDLGACVQLLARARGGDALPEAVTCAVTIDVRDRRVDTVRLSGGPGWFSPCERVVRGAFEGDLPQAEDTDYTIRLGVTLTPDH